MCDRVQSNFKSLVVKFIHKLVVCVLMTDEVGDSDGTPVLISSVIHSFTVCYDVLYIDAIIKSEEDELQRIGNDILVQYSTCSVAK